MFYFKEINVGGIFVTYIHAVQYLQEYNSNNLIFYERKNECSSYVLYKYIIKHNDSFVRIIMCFVRKKITIKSYWWGSSWINGAYTVHVVGLPATKVIPRHKGVRLTQSGSRGHVFGQTTSRSKLETINTQEILVGHSSPRLYN